jgi:hypothetical protein
MSYVIHNFILIANSRNQTLRYKTAFLDGRILGVHLLWPPPQFVRAA